MTQEFKQSQSQRQQISVNQILGQRGNEVWENMKIMDGKIAKPLEDDYLKSRERLIEDGFVIETVTGRHKSGKGGKLMGDARLLLNDKSLRESLARTDRNLRVIKLPYVHCVKACMFVPEIPEQFRILPENEEQGLHIASEFQIYLAEQALFPNGEKNKLELVESLRRRKEAVAVIAEVSPPLAYPKRPGLPLDLEIISEQVSFLYWACFDERTRDNTNARFINQDRKQAADRDSDEFREALVAEELDLDRIFGGETKVVIDIEGEEVGVKNLAESEQLRIAKILRRSVGIPSQIERDNKWQDALVNKLFEEGKLESPDDVSYYNFIFRQMGEKVAARCAILTNKRIPGDKTYDVNYLLDNYITEKYPQLLDIFISQQGALQ